MASNKLNALKARNLVMPGRYGDGGGLWLQVRDADRRSWLFRYTLSGKSREMGLGPFPDLSLAEARVKAHEARRLVLERTDPIEHRRKLEAERVGKAAKTFKEVAERYLAAHENNWRNAKHRWQWRATLATHAYPVFGDKPVAAVSTGDVMEALEPLWAVKTETASRLRGRIESVLDYAKSRDWRSGENPARWRGHISNMLPRRNKARAVQHHPALPYSRVGDFMALLLIRRSTAALAMRFTILNAARTGEVLGAQWCEIDREKAIWTVPASRMKIAKEHRVPLTEQALAVISEAALLRSDLGADAFVFPGTRPRKPLSNMSMAMLLRRLNSAPEGEPAPWVEDGTREPITVHGFRSTFRDWVGESTGYAREVAEAALAHTLPDKVEASYARGDLFQKRRRLMADWATYCSRPDAFGAAVVPIRERVSA